MRGKPYGTIPEAIYFKLRTKKYMQINFFDLMEENNKKYPLASKMRPTVLDEIVGQQHILGKGKLLYRVIVADRLGSIILYGPPGTGKTTLAKVIANTTDCIFRQINATNAGKKDVEEVVKEAKNSIITLNKRTILFIDEIYRFNKSQQDYLLPFVENGTLTLVGATTENPYFEVNNALLSRCRIFELKPLSKDDLITLIDRTLMDKEKAWAMIRSLLIIMLKNFWRILPMVMQEQC